MWTLIRVSKQSCSQVYLSSCHTLGLLTSLVWTNLFNTSFRYTTSSWYYPMIGQLWQLTSTLTSLCAQRLTNMPSMLNPPTPHLLTVWHFDTRNGFLLIWNDAYTLPPSLIPPFLARSLFYHCSLGFFARLDWPRVWHRLFSGRKYFRRGRRFVRFSRTNRKNRTGHTLHSQPSLRRTPLGKAPSVRLRETSDL